MVIIQNRIKYEYQFNISFERDNKEIVPNIQNTISIEQNCYITKKYFVWDEY